MRLLCVLDFFLLYLFSIMMVLGSLLFELASCFTKRADFSETFSVFEPENSWLEKASRAPGE